MVQNCAVSSFIAPHFVQYLLINSCSESDSKIVNHEGARLNYKTPNYCLHIAADRRHAKNKNPHNNDADPGQDSKADRDEHKHFGFFGRLHRSCNIATRYFAVYLGREDD